MDTDLETFYKIGSHLTCTTALGKSVTGYLIAYHLEQNLLLLKIVSSTENTKPSGLENLDQQQNELKRKYDKLDSMNHQIDNNGSIISKSSSQNGGTGPPGFEHVEVEHQNSQDSRNNSNDDNCNSNTETHHHDYTLLNLRYIATIEEDETKFIDVDKIYCSSKMTKIDNDNSQSISDQNSIQNPKNLIDAGLQTPIDINISKMVDKLADKKSEKLIRAKLTDLGVTTDAVQLKNYLEKTLGSQNDTIHWDENNGDIIIFDEIVISGPNYDKSSCRILEGANPQTKKHVDKLIDKFYNDKTKRQKL